MTSGWQHSSVLAATALTVRSGLTSLPGPQEDRLRQSLESLPRYDSENELTKREEMDTPNPAELQPDYDDDDQDQQTAVLGNAADLSTLPDLSETIVLQVVKNRYQRDQIYTCCGDVLISVNPYKQIHIFDEKAHEAYSLGVASSQEPHVFRTAREAISRRARDNSDQVVLVSGESGAGKTEATKLMLKHILHLSASHKDELYESIDKVNPLIELFGNARTTLNENSSRFAKFLEVRFCQEGRVSGATIRDYILEKSRVVSPCEGESNFHIFYTFLDDVMASPDRQTQFLMDGMNKRSDFRIVPRSSWHGNDARLSGRQQADIFRQIGMQEEEVDNLHTVLAAILHLTNIQFVDDDGSSGGVVVDNEDTMNKAAALLSVSPEQLAAVLVTTRKTFRGQEIQTFKSHAKANETRDAIAKALYERLFGWLIRRINMALSKSPPLGACIGFLDICGFEDLQQNSLEQLCINLANENLQRFMLRELFEQEMKVYQTEQLHVGHINPPSNEAILRLFDEPTYGILALINEDTRVEISTEDSMVKKLIDRHATSDHFLRYKNAQPRFGIKHFAGSVWYSADNFLEKNGDALSKEVKDTLVESNNELVSDIFQVQKAPTGSIAPTQFNYRVSQRHDIRFQKPGQEKLSTSMVRGLRQSLKHKFGEIPTFGDSGRTRFSQEKTVIDCFRASMKELLDKMGNAHPLFVRCIKPNDKQIPDNFDDRKVELQLRYNGVTEMARIRRLGFPVRTPFSQFLQRYCSLAQGSDRIREKTQAATAILQQCGVLPHQFRIGKTMIFLRDEASRALEGRKEEEEKREREEKERREREESEAEKRRKEAEEQKRMADAKKLLQPRNSDLKNVMTLDPVLEVPTPLSSIRTDIPAHGLSPASSPQDSITSSCTSGADEETDMKEGTDYASRGSSETQEDSKNNFWDIFRIVAREKPTTDIHHMTAMRIIKFLVYIFICCVVLATSTAQKVSLMLMIAASNMNDSEDEKKVSSAYYILLAIAICIPYILTFLTSAAKVAFGGFSRPSAVTWIWVIFIEALHTFGLSLLVFRVLPRLDIVHGLLFLSAVATVPSVLKPITGVVVSRRKRQHLYIAINWILDILAMLGQLSVFPVVFLLPYFGTTNQEDVLNILDVVGALVLVSLSCWENFVDGRFFVDLADGNPWKNFFLKRKFELERGRYFLHLVTSLEKIIFTILLAYLFRGNMNFDYQAAFQALSTFQTQWKAITAICVMTLSGVVCYYMSYIACKLWMQKISFVMPATLATPCAILVFFLNYQYEFLANVSSNSNAGELRVKWPSDLTVYWRTIVAGVAWWISLVLLTRYVWFPRQSRLAKIEMLFMNPLYCGILTIETLLLNRRRHTLSTHKRRSGLPGVYYYCLSRQELRALDEGDYAGESDAHTYTSIDDAERNASGDTLENLDNSYGGGGRRKMKQGEEEIPMIYACATMWHEVRREMVALLKSLHRLDQEQWLRKQAQEISGTKDKDYFEYEAHIFFDDAMTLDDKEEFIPNDYVKMVVAVMEEAASSVYKRAINVQDPIKIPTPYGGQLLWVMPCGNLLFVHLKDKAKIRHRKRWSQVMYMYYLLGFRLTRQCEEQIIQALRSGQGGKYAMWGVDRSNVYGSDIFDMLSDSVARKSQNTFVMALDGDTDFSPGAVHILLDRMKKNPKVGAACGRIHPIGSGPMVWYQMFEYAVGHWMQKATEHVLGCVLCSPGCFSLFRGSALMDDNVMKMYTILPTDPSHFLQYDQGEDRWLCTLLLQQGYRVDYAAAADAWTYAPEGFNEFFNQRRRWMPSTLANVMDLLADYSNTVAVNSNISMLYIAYQVALMVSTLIGPGTVLLMIAGAIGTVFRINLVWSYVFALVPAIIYVFVCLYCKSNIQLYLAAVLSAFYAFVMMVVFVGIIVIAAKESVFHPTVIITVIIAMIFIFAGLCHPMEIFCLPSGALYLLCIPSGYLLLVIYSLCNLHVVSWGTREAPKKKTKAELEQEEIEKKKKEEEKAKKKGFFSRFFFSSYLNDLKDIIQSATGNKNNDQTSDRSLQLLEEINENIKKLAAASTPGSPPPTITLEGVRVEQHPAAPKEKKKKSVKISKKAQEIPDESKGERDELKNPRWVEDKALGNGPIMELFQEELQFWQAFIKQYLKPLDADKKKEEEVQKGLMELRTNVVFAVCMVNLLWIAINFMFQFNDTGNVRFNIDGGVNADYLGLLFLFFLGAILLLQLLGMIVHRWGTLLHLLAFTDINLPCFKTKLTGEQGGTEGNFRKAFDFCKQMITDPPVDYGADDMEGNLTTQSIRDRLRATVLGTQQIGTQSVVQQLGREGVSVSGPRFLNSPEVNMYLRGTQRAGLPSDEEDMEARRFVDDFRSGVTFRSRRRYAQNGAARLSGSRADGYAPSLPRRQNSAYNDGVRRRLNPNNFRVTVRDAIERVKQTGIDVKPEDGVGWGGGGGVGGIGRGAGGDGGVGGGMGGGLGGYPGQMDRYFNRQMRHFNEHVSVHGRDAIERTVSSRHFERDRASRYRRQQHTSLPV